MKSKKFIAITIAALAIFGILFLVFFQAMKINNVKDQLSYNEEQILMEEDRNKQIESDLKDGFILMCQGTDNQSNTGVYVILDMDGNEIMHVTAWEVHPYWLYNGKFFVDTRDNRNNTIPALIYFRVNNLPDEYQVYYKEYNDMNQVVVSRKVNSLNYSEYQMLKEAYGG